MELCSVHSHVILAQSYFVLPSSSFGWAELSFIFNVPQKSQGRAPGRDFSEKPGIQVPMKLLTIAGNPWINSGVSELNFNKPTTDAPRIL